MPKKGLRIIMSRALIILGALIIAGALSFEIIRYPWAALLGKPKDAGSIPNPTPIALSGSDRDSTVINGSDNPETNVSAAPQDSVLPGNDTGGEAPPVFVELGIMKIPKLNVSQFVLEGTQRQLKYGVGHVSDSEGIGERGNCCIAGHRSAAFRYLDTLKEGDSIVFDVSGVIYTYTVYKNLIVLPNETWVLGDVDSEPYSLTLVTCTPYLVYSHRLIVRARLTDINGLPPDTYFSSTKGKK